MIRSSNICPTCGGALEEGPCAYCRDPEAIASLEHSAAIKVTPRVIDGAMREGEPPLPGPPIPKPKPPLIFLVFFYSVVGVCVLLIGGWCLSLVGWMFLAVFVRLVGAH